mgnify:CR=1 FL=1
MNYYLTLILVLFAYMNFWFVISLLKKRNDVADIAWGLGFVLMAWTSYFLVGDSGIRGLLANILVSIWGLRLAWYIYTRNKIRMRTIVTWRGEMNGVSGFTCVRMLKCIFYKVFFYF